MFSSNKTNTFLILLILTLLNLDYVQAQNSGLEELFKKEKIKILVTDSGLGGLSVLAGVENVLRVNKSFKEVELFFVNALPNSNYRYNSMPDEQTKIKVFNSALEGMYNFCRPDVILIACNTLSVIYPKTEFYKSAKIPVLNIVDYGVSQIMNEFQKDEKSSVVILGTETTITANSHKDELVKKGISEKQIYTQSCPNLESEIQNDSKSDMVYNMTDFFIDEVKGKLNNNPDNTIVSLCCSHYGYSTEIFEKVLAEKFTNKIKLLNPNAGMVKAFDEGNYSSRYPESKINVKVISQAEISDDERTAISVLIKTVSPASSEALINYITKKDLFKYN